MGFLILIGVLVLLLVRQSMGKRRQLEEERIEMQEGTERLKAELEKTGNEIIEKIETHVVKLEQLLKEADQGNRALDRRLTELQNALRKGTQIRESLGEIQQELEQARIDLEQETTKAQRVINVSRRIAASVSSMGVPSQLVVAQPPSQNFQQLPSAQIQPQVNIPLGQISESWSSQNQKESKPEPPKVIEKVIERIVEKSEPEPAEEKRVVPKPAPIKPVAKNLVPKNEAEAFAKVLQDSIDRDPEAVDEVPNDELGLPDDDDDLEFNHETKFDDQNTSDSMQDLSKDISKDSARARELLQDGWSVEEVARETGLGRGALELMKKMTPVK